MSDVFISYSRKDSEFVRQLFDALRERGREAWVDWQGIDYSTHWWEEICAGIEGANNFVLIVSQDALNSYYCHREIEHARKHHKRIITLLYRPVDPVTLVGGWYNTPELRPIETLARENWEEVQRIQWINYPVLNDLTKAVEGLLATVDTDPERVRLHTRLLLRVRDWELRGRTPDALLRGAELTDYETWLAQSAAAGDQPQPTAEQREFITLSRTDEVRHARRLRTQQRTTTGLILGTIILLLAALGSLYQVATARSELVTIATDVQAGRNEIQSLEYAAQAQTILSENGNAETAALLGIRALNAAYSTQADTSLVKAVDRLYTSEIWQPASLLSPDGLTYVTESEDGTLRLWDLASRTEFRSFSIPISIPAGYAVEFGPRGPFALAAESSDILRLWDMVTGQEVQIFNGDTGTFDSLAVSPDGRMLLMSEGYPEPVLHLWSIDTGEELRVFSGHTDRIFSIAFSPDGRTALSGSEDSTLRLWDVFTGEELQIFSGHAGGVISVAFSPDGHYVLSGSRDTTLRLWDVTTGQGLQVFSGHTNWVFPVIFSPDGRHALSGSKDTTVRLWNVDTGEELRVFSGHTDTVASVSFGADGYNVFSSSLDNTTRLWELPDGEAIRIFSGHNSAVTSVAFRPDGQIAASGSYDNTLRLWNVGTGDTMQVLSGHTDWVNSVEFSPDSRNLLSASSDGTLQMWDMVTGEAQQTIITGRGVIKSVKFSPDGNKILDVSYGVGDNLRLRNVKTGEIVRNFVNFYLLKAVAYSPDGRTVLSGGNAGTLHLWDVETGKELRTFAGHTDSIWSVAFSPDGRTVLSGSEDTTLRLWDFSTGEQLQVFSGHTNDVLNVAYSPDGLTVASGSNDFTVRLWDITTGEVLRVFSGHNGGVSSVAFSPDGRFILSGSGDGTLRLWDSDYRDFITYACTRVFRDFTDAERQQYGIPDGPTCPQFGGWSTAPTHTPIATATIPVWTPIASPTPSLTPSPTATP